MMQEGTTENGRRGGDAQTKTIVQHTFLVMVYHSSIPEHLSTRHPTSRIERVGISGDE
jgi:hypothetical protein